MHKYNHTNIITHILSFFSLYSVQVFLPDIKQFTPLETLGAPQKLPCQRLPLSNQLTPSSLLYSHLDSIDSSQFQGDGLILEHNNVVHESWKFFNYVRPYYRKTSLSIALQYFTDNISFTIWCLILLTCSRERTINYATTETQRFPAQSARWFPKVMRTSCKAIALRKAENVEWQWLERAAFSLSR